MGPAIDDDLGNLSENVAESAKCVPGIKIPSHKPTIKPHLHANHHI